MKSRAAFASTVACGLLLAAACSGSASPSRVASPPRAVQVRSAAVRGRSFYVSPHGNDAGRGSLGYPWQHIGVALSRLRPGDHLYVRGGWYVERVKVHAFPGRPDAPIVVTGWRGEQPLIVGQLWVGEPSYWTIRQLNVAWSTLDPNEPMVRIYGGTHWVLENSRIVNAHSTSGLHIDDGPRNDLGTWAVVNNCIFATMPTNGPNQDNDVYIDDMSRSPDPRGLIAHNVIFASANGRGIKLGPGGPTGGPRNVIVRNNTIAFNVSNISVSRDSSNILISGNILVNARDANIAGFELAGHGVVATHNIASSAPRFLSNSGNAIANVGNVLVPQVRFDAISCSGFHPLSLRGFGAHG